MGRNECQEEKTVCHFGTFPKNQAYSRNLIVAACLRSAGWKITECRVETELTTSRRVHSFKSPFIFLSSLLSNFRYWLYLILRHARIPDYDLMLVGYPSHIDVCLGFLLARLKGRPLVMDAFISLYDTVVKDRRLIVEYSMAAKILWLYEWAVLHLADKVMVDTKAHKEMMIEMFRLRPDRIFAVPVGIDENVWRSRPMPARKETFHAALWSTFIPLHGMETVVRAAEILSEKNCPIQILVMGEGQTADRFEQLIQKKKLNNIIWKRGFFDIQALVEMAAVADCCLGIFGKTEKASRVVPYKVYQALALARPVITAESTEMKRLFKKKPGGILVPAADGEQLAAALITLATDAELCHRFSENARKIYDNYLSNKIIEQKLDCLLQEIHNKKAR